MRFGARPTSVTVRMIALVLVVSLCAPVPALAGPLPHGWEIVAGSAEITAEGGEMTVLQHTGSLIANWESFSIGEDASVAFVQPDASSVALNRVVGSKPSEILGRLSANGRVLLVNPRGIVFGEGARVDTAALVASTLDIPDQAFLEGRYAFSAGGAGGRGATPGSIVNYGDLHGAVVALISPVVQNYGTITGDTALVGGTDVLLDLDSSGLVGVRLDAATVETLVENHGLIRADGGTVVLTARAAGEALGGGVNNTGVIEARRFEERDGRIYLVGDRAHGAVHADGRLEAAFVETSAATVTVGEGLVVDTAGGEWLIDPVNITINQSMAAAIALSMALLGNVRVSTSPSLFQFPDWGSWESPGPGDIIVNAPVTWPWGILTLEADRHIVINAEMTSKGSGASAGLKLIYGKSDPSGDYFINSKVNLVAGNHFSTQKGSESPKVFTVITSLGTQDSRWDNTLQAIRSNPAGYYALGADIDASATANWNGGLGFEPLGFTYPGFTGVFEGLGHTIRNLSMDRTRQGPRAGLFATVRGGVVQNVGLVGAMIVGAESVGGIAGVAEAGARIRNVYVDGSVSAVTDHAGGLVGFLRGSSVENGRSLASVKGGNYVGGAVGYADLGASIAGSYAAGSVSGVDYTGGLVGYLYDGQVRTSLAAGDVTSIGKYVGGLVGRSWNSAISRSGATGSVYGAFESVGGLVGTLEWSTVGESFAAGPVRSDYRDVGGLIGTVYGTSRIENSYATGAVTGLTYVGGLIGNVATASATVRNVYATGRAEGSIAAGLIANRPWPESVVTGAFYLSGPESNGIGTPLPLEAMQAPATFVSAGWDFATVWSPAPWFGNGGFPTLQWQESAFYPLWPPGGVRLGPGSAEQGLDTREVGAVLAWVQEPGQSQPGSGPAEASGQLEVAGCPLGVLVVDAQAPMDEEVCGDR